MCISYQKTSHTHKKYICFVLTIIILIGVASFALADSAKGSRDTTPAREIYVVYDTSMSMYNIDGTTWCSAYYALESFVSMMGDKDTMYIYPMSSFEKKVEYKKLDEKDKIKIVSGADPERVVKVHNWTIDGLYLLQSQTPFLAVKVAKEAILADKSDTEKWFVIITDGNNFDKDDPNLPRDQKNEEIKDVGKAMGIVYDELESNNINTIYLAIGETASKISGTRNEKRVFYAENAKEILDKVIDATNVIFTKREIKATSVSETECGFSIDIPVSKYVLFIQGAENALKEFTINGSILQPSQTIPVKYREKNEQLFDSLAIKDVKNNPSLQGIMYVFNSVSPDEPYIAGDYSIKTTGKANNVRVFYNIGAQVNCEMKKDEIIVNPSDTLFSGTYTVTGIQFVDPTNFMQPIESELLDYSNIEIKTVYDDGSENVVSKGEKFKLSPGTVTLKVKATFNDIELTSEKTYQVLPYSKGYLDLADSQIVIDQLSLKNGGSKSFTVQLKDDETNQPMLADLWRNMTIEIPDENGIHWTAVYGENAPEMILTAKAANGYQNVVTGNINVNYDIIPFGDEDYKKSLTFPVTINAYSPFKIQKVEGTTTVSQAEVQNGNFTVNVYVTDEQGNLLSDEVWNNINITCSEPEDTSLSWTHEKIETGLFVLTGQSADNKALSITTGSHSLSCTVEYKDDEGFTKGISDSYGFEVSAIDLSNITLDDLKEVSINQSELGGEGKNILVKATDSNNEPLSEELWEAVQVTFSETHGLVLSCNKGENVSEYIVNIKANDTGCGNVPTTKFDDMTYEVSVNNVVCSQKQWTLNVEPWEPIFIDEIPSAAWNQDDFSDDVEKEISITIKKQNGEKLDAEEWKAISFDDIKSKYGLSYEIIKSAVPGEATVRIKSVDGRILSIVPGNHDIDIDVHFIVPEESFDYHISGSVSMTVEPSEDTGGGGINIDGTTIIKQEDLVNGNSIPVMIVPLYIVDKATGVEHTATAEEANITTVIIDDVAGLEFSVTQTALNEPTFLITAKAITTSGAVDCNGSFDLHWTTIREQNGIELGNDGYLHDIRVVPYNPVMFTDPDAFEFTIHQEDIKGKRNNTISINVRMKDGSAVTPELASYIQLISEVDSTKGLNWNITNNASGIPGSFTCTLTSVDGTMRSIATETYTVPVKVKYVDPKEEIDNTSDEASVTLTIAPCPVQLIDLEFYDIQDSYRGTRYKWDENKPFKVKAKYHDESLTQDIWDLVTDSCLQIETPQKDLDFDIQKSTTAGEWIVTLAPKNNKGYNTASGNVQLNAAFELEIDEIPYQGAKIQNIKIQADTLYRILEWLDDYKYPIIIILAVLYLFCGYYWCKCRLATRKYQIVFRMPNERGFRPVKLNITRDMLSVLIPWPFCKAQKAEINCYKGNLCCTFPRFTAVATGKRRDTSSFKIGKIGRIDNPEKYRINGGKIPKSFEDQTYDLCSFQVKTSQTVRDIGLVDIGPKNDD